MNTRLRKPRNSSHGARQGEDMAQPDCDDDAGDEGPVTYAVQTSALRNTVWIHASDGSTVGRFGRMGVDLHTTAQEQVAGASQCRLCTHGRSTVNDWKLFREKALEWWGVAVPEDAIDASLLVQSAGDAPTPSP